MTLLYRPRPLYYFHGTWACLAPVGLPMPPGKHFASIQERIAAVACPKEMVGELEIVATSNAIQRQISVKCANETLSYGEQYPGIPLVVRFTSMDDAEDFGHYDCVVQHAQKTRPESVRGVSPVRHYIGPEVISPKPTLTPGQKKKRAPTRSEVLTASPYKRALSERKEQSKSQKKKTSQKKKVSKNQKSGHKTKMSKKANWYCILCGENRYRVQCFNIIITKSNNYQRILRCH